MRSNYKIEKRLQHFKKVGMKEAIPAIIGYDLSFTDNSMPGSMGFEKESEAELVAQLWIEAYSNGMDINSFYKIIGPIFRILGDFTNAYSKIL